MLRNQSGMLGTQFCHSPYSLATRSLPRGWNLVGHSRLNSSVSTSTVLGYNSMRSHAHLLVQVLGFKLGSQAFAASTITQQSPRPSFISLCH